MNDFKTILVDYQNRVNYSLKEAIPALNPKILYEPMVYAVNIGGKRLRPILCQMCYEASIGKTAPIIEAALALELLHNFTLVHDDIMDDDDKRRGKPTVHVKWDTATGILSGDGILSYAYKILLKGKFNKQIMQVFTDGLVEVCEGQGFDKEFEDKEIVSEAEYMEMIGKKTGALISVPCQLGALVAESSSEIVNYLKSFGYNLGLAFQIQDDLLDITGDHNLFGKTYGSDIQAGKITYLYIKAIELLNDLDKENFLSILNQKGATQKEILSIKELYEKYKIIDITKLKINQLITETYLCLDQLATKFPDFDLRNIKLLTDYVANRQY